MKLAAAAAAVLAAIAATPVQADGKRQMGAHLHGESALDIAVEGQRVTMQLRAPGMDIVGFEHAARTPEQKVAVAQAEAALADPLALFVPPAEAGCRLDAAEVEHEHEGEKAHGHGHGHSHGHDKAAEGEGHAEFHASYTLVCERPAALTGLHFAFFDRFPGAEAVEVQVATDKGQSRFEVTRERPRLDLGGLV